MWFLAAAQNREADAYDSLGHHRLRRCHRNQERPWISEGGRLSARRCHAPRRREGQGFRAPAWRSSRADRADDLINDPEVDAVYVATPPSSHCSLALKVAAAGKPCLVEKPMALSHEECLRMIDAFHSRETPLWVAYYRRALPRFLTVRDCLRDGAIGRVTSVHVQVSAPLLAVGEAAGWRVDPAQSRRRIVLRSGLALLRPARFPPGRSTCRVRDQHGRGLLPEDVTAAAFEFGSYVGTGVWNFHAFDKSDRIVITVST